MMMMMMMMIYLQQQTVKTLTLLGVDPKTLCQEPYTLVNGLRCLLVLDCKVTLTKSGINNTRLVGPEVCTTGRKS
jgi:hypothetical protein